MLEYSDFITIYFTEERIQSLFFIIIGVITLLLAAIFLFIIKHSFFKGMAISLLVIALIQLSVGISIYKSSLKDIERINHFMRQEPQKITIEEIPRMEKVIDNLIIYKLIEVLLIAVGIIVWLIFNKSPQTYWKGLALGLIIQSSVMLSLDLIAEKRAKNYCIELQLIKSNLISLPYK